MVQNLTYHPPLGESDHVFLRFNALLGRSEKALCLKLTMRSLKKSCYVTIGMNP